jgi:hypothetical protein
MDYNPWHPITDPVDLKTLGKLGEETGELGQAVCRCIIQGMNEFNVKEGETNQFVLQCEVADVLANIELVIDRFAMDREVIAARIAEKLPKLRQWHGMA